MILNYTNSSPFAPTTSIYTILERLTIEQWSKNISYQSFFDQCAPEYCTYSINQRRDILLIITVLLGFFGGLNVTLKLLTPMIIRFISWIITHRRRM